MGGQAKVKKLPEDVIEWFRKQGRKGGKIGGPARARKLTPEQRSESSRKAGLAGGRGRPKRKAA
jgi:hypothetical protein